MKRMIALVLALIMMCGMIVPAAAAEDVDVSAEPTAAPSSEPEPVQETEATAAPMAEPTAGPTAEPTELPETSAEPTAAPTAEPTEVPTESAAPTEEPEASIEPSAGPETTEEPLEESEQHTLFRLMGSFPASTGQVDIAVSQALELGRWTPALTASLTGPEQRTLSVQADGSREAFHDLPAGEYTLTLSGQGIAACSQTIQVGQSDGIYLQFTVGRLAGYETGAHPGILQLGDVNGDGILDAADRDSMMRAVDGETVDAFTDLNGDGVTDLADAEYLARGEALGKLPAEERAATEEHFVPSAAITPVVEETTQVTGQMSDIFQDSSEGVTLGTADAQPISADDPVEVSFGLAAGAASDAIVIDSDNITAGEILVDYEDADGTEKFLRGIIGESQAPTPVAAEGLAAPVRRFGRPLLEMSLPGAAEIPTVQVHMDADGNLTMELGGQVAVKQVKLTITGTKDNGSLAEISQVEFVNGMDKRIPEPALDIPVLKVPKTPGSRQVSVSWGECVNVTGYEVQISAGGVTETIQVTGTSLTVTSFNKDEVRNYTTYQVQARSVNGSWTSGWSEPVNVTPKPTSRPDKPDNVKAVGGYQTVTVSWKNMKDTTTYDLYYKEKSAKSYQKIGNITASSYILTGLNSAKATVYEVYVVGKNEFGDSDPSMHASAATATLDPPMIPRFGLINRDSAGTPGAYHITATEQTGGKLIDSPKDKEAGTAWATVDGVPASYYYKGTWDDGGFNNLGPKTGIIYTLDGFYEMDTIAVMAPDGMNYGYAKVRWWDEDGQEHLTPREYVGVETRRDEQGRAYYLLRMPEPIRTNKIQIGLSRAWAGNNQISIAEVYFYNYDPLKRELSALYADDLHTTLKDNVTEQMLNDLKGRIEASVDAVTGEVNPEKEQLLREWQTAWEIFHDQFMGKVTVIHTGITGRNDEHGFGGLNAWQPLGVTAAAGETVTVYVGHSTKRSGSSTNLQLVATQYHAEASAMSTVVTTLKIGANQVQIPKIWTTSGIESGGALYVQYTGYADSSDSYAVRVSGGVSVPRLDLYGVTDAGERLTRTKAYLEELRPYVDGMETLHGQVHQGENAASSEVDMAYAEQDCILGASDIMLDTMMLSLPARQIMAGCGGDAKKLLASLDAMEQMMALFYQHKGLNATAKDAVDRIPSRHLNIRYQRMFSGAFMYASGDHIGIGWSETDDMAGCAGVQADEKGLYRDGSYFGWGIAHEIGHDINQGSYAIAEITNNYFAVLAQAKDTNDSVRFKYDDVYAKVTSGAKGAASNVFTQLGMYWQLHLAYDKGYNFKTYESYDQQLENLFFARVDTYARTPSKAPAPGGVALTLEGADTEQTLMRLACAAAEKNILDFFRRWGKTPDSATVAYAGQFPEETRAIYYVSDDARRYVLEHGGKSSLADDGSTAAIAGVKAAADRDQANKVDITITPSGAVDSGEILGYEIVRCTIAGGRTERRPVGFTTTGSFSDVVYTMNNRTVSYEVTLVDKYLNRSAAATAQAVKIQHEGALDKTEWRVMTDGLTVDPDAIAQTPGSDDMPEGASEDPALRMVDGKTGTVYTAEAEESAVITLDFRAEQVITGFKYTAGGPSIGVYAVDVHQDGEWVRAAEGALDGDKTVYFANADGRYVSTYAADGLRLTLTGRAGREVSIAELDVLGLTGDNVDFRSADGTAAIGYLEKTFQYGQRKTDIIPAGSLVFSGSYKGNAAYNVVMLYDEQGNVVAGPGKDGKLHAYQTILSTVPVSGPIQDVADGTWLYWIQPEDMQSGFALPKRVRAELYRVNNAQTNEGERLVSDSLFVDVPATPGNITIQGVSVG